MERFETDTIADERGMVHVRVGRPGARVHVSVETAEPVAPIREALALRDRLAAMVWPDVPADLVGRRWTEDERRTLLGVDAE
jgi:hypothetical protein